VADKGSNMKIHQRRTIRRFVLLSLGFLFCLGFVLSMAACRVSGDYRKGDFRNGTIQDGKYYFNKREVSFLCYMTSVVGFLASTIATLGLFAVSGVVQSARKHRRLIRSYIPIVISLDVLTFTAFFGAAIYFTWVFYLARGTPP
jgi:hypothetical protein